MLAANSYETSLILTNDNNQNTAEVFKIEPVAKEQMASTIPELNINEVSYELAANISNIDINIDEYDFPESKELSLPERAIETYAGNVVDSNNSKWTTYHVKSYDNTTNIFYKVGHQELLNILKDDKEIYKNIKKLKKGSIVRASTANGQLSQLVFTHDNKNSYVITNKNGKYQGNWKDNLFEVRQARASFTIENGLFFDGKKAGIASDIIKQIVKVFDWDIDFSHDVRIGDKVTAVFEEIYHDGDKVDNQHLLAAEFINKGRKFRSIRYTYKDGKSDYFTPQGREMKKAFIRTPIEHARVSSHFNPGRFHPKLHKIRAHKGTDFAARTGTAIMATGNGVIKSIGRKGGYGRTIIIQHREGYTTTYAHMSRYKKGLKLGGKVYQGDTIGYVGRSGLATGPHLHYELHQAKKAVNPMTVVLPNSMSLSKSELQDFRNKAINLVLQLNVLHRFVEADIDIDSAFGG
jgi:murein DD-endopeptidase MepM/ murein hydrolase activator NlpD